MQKNRYYIQPTVDFYPTELSTAFLGGQSSERPTGYAIDNTDADDGNVIPITEQDKDESLWDTFIEID